MSWKTVWHSDDVRRSVLMTLTNNQMHQLARETEYQGMSVYHVINGKNGLQAKLQGINGKKTLHYVNGAWR